MDSNTQLLNLKEKPMKQFLIRREMEGAGSIPKHELNNAGKGSEEVLEAMRSEGKNIMQEQSGTHLGRIGWRYIGCITTRNLHLRVLHTGRYT